MGEALITRRGGGGGFKYICDAPLGECNSITVRVLPFAAGVLKPNTTYLVRLYTENARINYKTAKYIAWCLAQTRDTGTHFKLTHSGVTGIGVTSDGIIMPAGNSEFVTVRDATSSAFDSSSNLTFRAYNADGETEGSSYGVVLSGVKVEVYETDFV